MRSARTVHVFGFYPALAVLMSCQVAPDPPASTDTADTRASDVIEASRAIVAAFGRDDPDAYFRLFDPGATFIFYTTPRRLESRAEYQQEWVGWRRDLGFRVRSCTSSGRRVQLLGDVAILTHSVRTEITTKDGDATLHERETIVFQHRDGRWVAVHEHLSPMPEAPGDTAAATVP